MKELIKSTLLSVCIIVVLVLASLLFPRLSSASDYHILNVDELNVVYMGYTGPGSDPMVTNNYLTQRGLDKHLELNLKVSILDYLYTKARVHSDTDYNTATNTTGQFRTIGLESEIGLRVSSLLDVFIYHHSQHVLDTISSFPYPVQDAVGFRINLIKNKREESLIQ